MTSSIKTRKAQVFDFFVTQGAEWKILISRKALELGENHYAEVSLDQKIIIINPYKSVIEFVDSIVHEVLHILYPRSYEKTIIRWEKEVAANLSPSDKTLLLDLVFTKTQVQWDE